MQKVSWWVCEEITSQLWANTKLLFSLGTKQDYDDHKGFIIIIWGKKIVIVRIGIWILSPGISSMVYIKWQVSVEEHIRMPCVPGFAQSVSNWAGAPRAAKESKPAKSVTQRGGSFLLVSYRQFNKACRGCVEWKTSVSTDIFRLLWCLK